MTRFVRCCLIGFVVSAATAMDVAPAGAFSSGIPSSVLGPSGCNQCHSGGSVPTIKLHGPIEVEPGSTNEYQLSIVVRGNQDHGGLNASVTDGVLSLGGSFADGTRVVAGATGEAEITHSAAKITDVWNQVEFTFLWTAPDPFTGATLNVWGNAVDHSGDNTGDQASFASLEIFLAGTLPHEDPCAGNLVPHAPPLVSDAGAQGCRAAIAKAGLAHTRAVLKAKQKCLQDFQRWGLTGEPYPICVGADGAPPSNAETAQAVAEAERKALSLLDKKCTDADVAGLGLCADTVEGLKSCLAASQQSVVGSLLEQEFGDLRQTDDLTLRQCQKLIAGETAKYVAARLKVMQKCLAARDKDCAEDDAAALCMGSVVDGSYVPPTDAKTAAAIDKAESKMRAKIAFACSDEQVAELDTCGTGLDDLGNCLVCTHRRASYDAVGVQYGEADAAAPPACRAR